MKTVYHPTLPTSQDVPDGDLRDWLASGWLSTPPEPVADSTYDQATANIAAVLEHVGGDKVRAAQALVYENSHKARPSLVAKFEKLANPAAPNQEGESA